LRIIYIAASRGIINEAVKLIGLLAASFFSLHYYSLFLAGVFTQKPFSFNRIHVDYISFLIIFIVTVSIFMLIRKILAVFTKKDDYPRWEKWSSLFLGMFRGSLMVSLLVFFISISPLPAESIQESFSSRIFRKIAPLIYIKTINCYKKVNPQAEVNKEVASYYEH
jgi:uncharacterized membrane protein required for colicin V production